MIVLLTILSLILGVLFGLTNPNLSIIQLISSNTDYILYFLMFSVGVSVGMQKGIFSKFKLFNIHIFLVPLGTIIGSLLGGVICSLILKMPIAHGTAVAGGMGWYSLSGATISKMANAQLGSIAFMSNLLREIFSFMLIPFLALKLNPYACIACAGATSEDTTLPVILKYTNEETVVLSVINGVICSFFVPILISLCLS